MDGVPLDGAALLKGVLMRTLPETSQKNTPTRRSQEVSRDADYNDDIDGVPSKSRNMIIIVVYLINPCILSV